MSRNKLHHWIGIGMNEATSHRRTEITASIGLVIGGMMWGLFWMPVRLIAGLGLPGAWAGIVIYTIATIVLLPVVWINRKSLRTRWPALLVCGLFTGAAFSLYTTSLSFTEVVRVILLFYLTPIWGTFLGVTLLGERLTLNRVLALLLGFGGLLVVLGLGEGFPWPRNPGDWMALASGLAWAFGSMKLYQMEFVPVSEQVLAFLVGSLFVTFVTLLLGGSTLTTAVDPGVFVDAVPYALLSAVYVLPMLYLTVWPATLLAPGRVGLLLMSDAVVGVASAAAFSGEPFGWRETLGTAMIVGAALVEVLGARKSL